MQCHSCSGRSIGEICDNANVKEVKDLLVSVNEALEMFNDICTQYGSHALLVYRILIPSY